MKQSFTQLKKLIREAYLDAEKALFLQHFLNEFNLKKDWDSDPKVIWAGELIDAGLKRKYKVEIHYGEDYPFHRPKVYPADGKIKNNRHQNPNPFDNSLPGDICIFQNDFSDWVIGTDCREIIKRTINWFSKYEAGTLINEPAPPEIERYYSNENIIFPPQVVIAETLVDFENKKNGKFIWLPTQTGKLSIIATLKEETEQDSTISELARLMHLISPDDPGDSKKMLLGKWYLLSHEPFDPLPHSLSDLLRLIAKDIPGIHLKSLTLEMEANPPPFLALCYKTKFNNIHWLIYQFNFKSPPKSRKGDILGFRRLYVHQRILQTNDQSKAKILLTHHLDKNVLFRRISNYPLKELDKSKVLILGCGTIGSRVADLITKSGVGNLYLADEDVLKVGNISRHILPLNNIGLPKVASVKDYLLQRNPFLNIDCFNGDITNNKANDWLAKAIQDVDLVISCIGDDATEAWVNYATMAHSKQTLYCRVYAHATIGEILLSRPNKICFNCMSELLLEDSTIPRPPNLRFEDMVMFDDADCGAAFIPGSASDIDLVSLHCTRLAIDILSSKRIENSYWLVRGREFDASNNWQIDESLKKPYSLLEFSPIPKKTCPVCGFTITE